MGKKTMSAHDPDFQEDDTENNHKPFWSNCLIQAIKHHWKDPENVDYIVIDRAKGFHVMWIDKRERKIKHFTHRRMNGKFSSLWFKGTIENVEYDALKEWCEKNHVKFNLERP